MAYQIFTERVLELIASIPQGKVMTYGGIAAFCGHAKQARQVARLLSSLSKKHGLPWHRVVNSQGKISLPHGGAYELQKSKLEQEGVELDENDKINLKIFLWTPT